MKDLPKFNGYLFGLGFFPLLTKETFLQEKEVVLPLVTER